MVAPPAPPKGRAQGELIRRYTVDRKFPQRQRDHDPPLEY